MNKITVMFFIVTIIGIGFFSGCEEQETNGIISGDTHLVKVLNHNMRKNTTQYSYDFLEVYGTVKNIAGKNLDNVRLAVQFFDSNGTLLDIENDNIYSLTNGDTNDFSVMIPDYYIFYEKVDNYKIIIYAR